MAAVGLDQRTGDRRTIGSPNHSARDSAGGSWGSPSGKFQRIRGQIWVDKCRDPVGIERQVDVGARQPNVINDLDNPVASVPMGESHQTIILATYEGSPFRIEGESGVRATRNGFRLPIGSVEVSEPGTVQLAVLEDS